MTSAHRLRRATAADAPAVAALWAACLPFLVRTVASVEPALAASRTACVVEEAGQVVGYAALVHDEPPASGARLHLLVHPDAGARGVGSALLDRMERTASADGVAELRAEAHDDGRSTEFARRRGYVAGSVHRFAGCDPRTAPDPPRPPDGVRLVPLAEVGDVAEIWHAHNATADDDPSGMTPRMSYEVWLREFWQDPEHTPALGAAALVDGRVAAYTMMQADPEAGRAWSTMTGTLPAYRGRGLAKLVKAAALRNAATSGYTSCTTGNDLQNGPMLAVNAWLGYREVARSTAMRKQLATG